MGDGLTVLHSRVVTENSLGGLLSEKEQGRGKDSNSEVLEHFQPFDLKTVLTVGIWVIEKQEERVREWREEESIFRFKRPS